MSEIRRLCCRGRERMKAVLSGIIQTMRENRKDRSGYLPDILRRRLITRQLASITLPVHARIESGTRTGHHRWALRRYMRQAVTGKRRPGSACPHPLFRRIRPDKKTDHVSGTGRQHNGQMREGGALRDRETGHRPDQQETDRLILLAIRLCSTHACRRTKYRRQDLPCPGTKFNFSGNPEAGGGMRAPMFPRFKTIETHRQFIRTPFTDVRSILDQTAEKSHIPETLRCRTQNGLRRILRMPPSIHERGL